MKSETKLLWESKRIRSRITFPGLPWWLSDKESSCWYRRCWFDPWSGEIPWATEQLSRWATTVEPVLWSLCFALREATAVSMLHTTTKSSPLLAITSEEPMQQRRPSTAKKRGKREEVEPLIVYSTKRGVKSSVKMPLLLNRRTASPASVFSFKVGEFG